MGVQMISLYWTVIPVLLVHYYAAHPLAQYNLWRSKIVILLTWIWAIRLNHNYLRREKWQWGAREDWRFSDMRAQYGKHWWWISFFVIYVAQQVLSLALTLSLVKAKLIFLDSSCSKSVSKMKFLLLEKDLLSDINRKNTK